MVTLKETPENLQPLFQYLLDLGWKQDKNHESEYILEHGKSGITANVLSFPIKYIGIISKAGTILYGGGTKLKEIKETLKEIKNKLK